MKRLVTFSVLALSLLLASSALADTIPITAVDGTWTNAVPPVTINNATDPRTARWGDPVVVPLQSGYDWSPRATPFDAVSDGTLFSLGTFIHQNFPIYPPFLSSIDLDFSLTIDALSPITGVFNFTHNETPNSSPCVPGGATICPDVVTVAAFLNVPFNYLGNDYFFSLTGFSQDGGVTTTSQFITEEDQANVAQLYGQITETPVTVPEPTTLLLLGSGLLGLVALRRRVKK